MKSQPWLEIYNELNIEMPSFTGRTMGSYLEEHAQVKSDAIALTMFNKSMTFSEYNAEANRLANSLSKLNIGKGDVVGLHMPNILQYVIALAAISKMGAIGTGISPIMAPVEVVNQIKDANVKALLSFEDLGATLQGVAELPSCLEQVIVCGVQDYNSSTVVSVPQLSGVEVTAFKELIEGQSIEFESVDTNPEDTFMIQYTGGTTGAPKGAQLSHRALVCNAQITYATSIQ
jgi:long-chain acyl-CoA synthetase